MINTSLSPLRFPPCLHLCCCVMMYGSLVVEEMLLFSCTSDRTSFTDNISSPEEIPHRLFTDRSQCPGSLVGMPAVYGKQIEHGVLSKAVKYRAASSYSHCDWSITQSFNPLFLQKNIDCSLFKCPFKGGVTLSKTQILVEFETFNTDLDVCH